MPDTQKLYVAEVPEIRTLWSLLDGILGFLNRYLGGAGISIILGSDEGHDFGHFGGPRRFDRLRARRRPNSKFERLRTCRHFLASAIFARRLKRLK